MAKLTSSGIVFGDSTVLNSKYGIVPQSSVSIFYQSSAPTGWTKSTTHNDKTLRVVNGTGGGSGGTSSFTSVFPGSLRTISTSSIPMSGTVGDTTLATPQLPSHTHPNGGTIGLNLTPGQGDVAYGNGWTRTSPSTGGGPTSGGNSHTHPWSGTASFTIDVDLRVQYIDVIVCSFN